MSFLMVKSSQSLPRDSDALKPSSNPWWSVKKCPVSMKLLTNQSLSAISILEKISIATSSCLEEPLCTLAFPNVSANKWLPLLLQPWRSRLWLLPKESSWSGLEVQSFHPFLHSRLCGLPRANIKRLVLLLFTENVSDSNHHLSIIIKWLNH